MAKTKRGFSVGFRISWGFPGGAFLSIWRALAGLPQKRWAPEVRGRRAALGSWGSSLGLGVLGSKVGGLGNV